MKNTDAAEGEMLCTDLRDTELLCILIHTVIEFITRSHLLQLLSAPLALLLPHLSLSFYSVS